MSTRIVFALDDVRAVLEAHEWTPGKTDWDYTEYNACRCGEPMSTRDQATGKRKISVQDYDRWLAHIEIELVRRSTT